MCVSILLVILLSDLRLILVILEAASRNLVQAQDGLVGVLDENELSVLTGAAEAHVGNGTDDTPAVGQGEVHLVGEVAGLPADNAQDDVLVVRAGVESRDETNQMVSILRYRQGTEGGKHTQASSRQTWTRCSAPSIWRACSCCSSSQ